jgi:hypothetical protein
MPESKPFKTWEVSSMLVLIADVLPKSEDGVTVVHDEAGHVVRIGKDATEQELYAVAQQNFVWRTGNFTVEYSLA